jgi:glycosyltransferase involved in cell wall biosynthesis
LSLWKRTWYAQWWFRIADALATRLADRVTVNATPLVADHAAWTWLRPERLAVVHNGLDPARVVAHGADARQWLRQMLQVSAETPVVGTVGRLAPEKDQSMFVRAVALACADRPDLHAVIVGDGVMREPLEREIGALGLSGRVHLLGERADSRRIIAGLDLFVLTSHIEGFANVLLEAAFLGVPSLSTRVGGAVDLLDDGDLVMPGDADGTCRGILDRLARPEWTERQAAATRQRAFERFTADRSTSRWFALYDQVWSDQGEGQ